MSETTGQALLDIFSEEDSELIELGKRIGSEHLNDVLDVFGGMKPHIPSADNFWRALERRKRDAEIKAAFKGNNLDALMEAYNLTERRLRQILFEGKKKRQGNGNAAPLKAGTEYHAEVLRLASDHGVTARTMCDVLLDVALKCPELVDEIGERLGSQGKLFETEAA